MKIGENLVNEVPVEKSIPADFDQFIILVNKWKGKLVHEGGTITGRSTWRSLTIFGCLKSCLDLKVLNARTVKRQTEEVEEFQKRGKRGQ